MYIGTIMILRISYMYLNSMCWLIKKYCYYGMEKKHDMIFHCYRKVFLAFRQKNAHVV